MTKMLDDAVAKIRELPEEQQDLAAQLLTEFAEDENQEESSPLNAGGDFGDDDDLI